MPHRLASRKRSRRPKSLRRERKKKTSTRKRLSSKNPQEEGVRRGKEEEEEESDSINALAANTGATTSISRTPLLDAYLADLQNTPRLDRTLCKLQRETNLMLLESCRSLGVDPPPTPLTGAGYTPGPATVALLQFIKAVKKGSYIVNHSEGNGGDDGKEEDDEAENEEGNGEDIGSEEQFEDQDEDSSPSHVSTSDATDNSPHSLTSADNNPPRPVPSLFASLWTDDFAQQYDTMHQDAMNDFPSEMIIDEDALRELYMAYQNALDTMPVEIVITEEDMREHYRSMYGSGFV